MMGKLLASYKKALVDEIVDNIASNTSQYYAFAANPVPYTSVAQEVTNDDFSTYFINDWTMLFGKKLFNNDILPVIDRNIWSTNTVYDRYDNTSNTLYENANFYVVSEPSTSGGDYRIYKCIDNANGSVSTVDPSSIGTPTQPTTFQTSDNYKWRYISSVSSAIYDKFATNDYIPVYPNTTIQSSSLLYSGVEVVMISNSGAGYDAYTSGTVRSNPNSTLIQIENSSSDNNDFYVNNAIYIYNISEATSQLKIVADYVSNSSGKWIFLDSPANTSSITPSVTQYLISPRVVFNTDGSTQPRAYTTINASSNSINSIVILDKGSNITRAEARVVSNSSFGSGANVYCIVPPPGGHGNDPAIELDMKGFAVSFNFANSESNTIITSNTVYNKIGIIKNPHILESNGTKGARYSSNTYNQTIVANVSPSFVFTTSEVVTGSNSGAKGIVVFSNTSQVILVGDKNFEDGELLANSSGSLVTSIAIQSIGDIYTKDVKPLYVQNINNVNRLDNQTESFKLVIKV
jgi:hypothetical protein